MIHLDSLEACLLELNSVELSPTKYVWYFNFGATHRLLVMNMSSHALINHKHCSSVKSMKGHSYDAIKVGNVDYTSPIVMGKHPTSFFIFPQ
jgi:hypothetical protein